MENYWWCDFGDAYRHVKETVTLPNTGTTADLNNIKNVTFKNCAPFTDCVSKINRI